MKKILLFTFGITYMASLGIANGNAHLFQVDDDKMAFELKSVSEIENFVVENGNITLLELNTQAPGMLTNANFDTTRTTPLQLLRAAGDDKTLLYILIGVAGAILFGCGFYLLYIYVIISAASGGSGG